VSARPGHASHDRGARLRKAAKMIRILESDRPLAGSRVLEIGTGSGIIAACLAQCAGATGSVTSVDVVDQRVDASGYRFLAVSGTELPFADASFDVVVSNHVIEHVGAAAAQLSHLREMRRVMRGDGLGYLAAPNRWALVEPHYHLPLLSWLPRGLADLYVRWSGKASGYDCFPPGPIGLRRSLRAAGLRGRAVTAQAALIMAELEGGPAARRAAALVPAGLLGLFGGLSPTLVFLVEPRAAP